MKQKLCSCQIVQFRFQKYFLTLDGNGHSDLILHSKPAEYDEISHERLVVKSASFSGLLLLYKQRYDK